MDFILNFTPKDVCGSDLADAISWAGAKERSMNGTHVKRKYNCIRTSSEPRIIFDEQKGTPRTINLKERLEVTCMEVPINLARMEIPESFDVRKEDRRNIFRTMVDLDVSKFYREIKLELDLHAPQDPGFQDFLYGIFKYLCSIRVYGPNKLSDQLYPPILKTQIE